MNKIESQINPESALIMLAINHYITTSDDIGTGYYTSVPNTTNSAILIPVMQHDPRDGLGISLLRSRLEKIQPMLSKLKIGAAFSTEQPLRLGGMLTYSLIIPSDKRARRIIAGLLVSPIFLVAWGHSKQQVDIYCRANPAIAGMLKDAEATVASMFPIS